MLHNRYQEVGGEDAAVAADVALLRARGHEVTLLEKDNAAIASQSVLGRTEVAIGTVWSRSSRREVAAAIERVRPDIVHVHNTFPLWSASVLAAANDARVPVVAVLHNYRLTCASPYLFRDGHPCFDCVGRRLPWPALVHRCYHDSVGHTAVQVATQTVHRGLSTWARRVDQFLAVSQAAGDQLCDAGVVPREKLFVRPNFLAEDPGQRAEGDGHGELVMIGRLVPEKGWETLLDAVRIAGVRVRVIGAGPDRDAVAAGIRARGIDSDVELVGPRSRAEVLDHLRRARALVLPSLWDEPLPMVLIEASAVGTPMIASRVGGVPEVVDDGETGLLVPPGDVAALAAALTRAQDEPATFAAMGRAARQRWEERFSGDIAYSHLLEAYDRAAVSAGKRTSS
jgi:glycosyltransferase involved in cell wall biosynthesis